MKGNREPGTKRNHEIAIRRSYNVEDLSYFGRATVLLAVELEQQTKQTLPSVLPLWSSRLERLGQCVGTLKEYHLGCFFEDVPGGGTFFQATYLPTLLSFRCSKNLPMFEESANIRRMCLKNV